MTTAIDLCPDCETTISRARTAPGWHPCSCGAEYGALAMRADDTHAQGCPQCLRQGTHAPDCGRVSRSAAPGTDRSSAAPALPPTGQGAKVLHLEGTTPSAAVSYRRVVDELLRYAAAEARAYGSSPGAFARVLPRADGRLWVGSGNRGTKGVGRAVVPEPMPPADPETRLRMLALPRSLRPVVEAILDDQLGWHAASIDLAIGSETPVPTRPWPLEARIGVRLSSPAQVAAWGRKVLTKDSAPALASAHAVGAAALVELARRWGR